MEYAVRHQKCNDIENTDTTCQYDNELCVFTLLAKGVEIPNALHSVHNSKENRQNTFFFCTDLLRVSVQYCSCQQQSNIVTHYHYDNYSNQAMCY